MKRTLTMSLLLVFSGALVDAQRPAKPAKQYSIDVSEKVVDSVRGSDGPFYGAERK